MKLKDIFTILILLGILGFFIFMLSKSQGSKTKDDTQESQEDTETLVEDLGSPSEGVFRPKEAAVYDRPPEMQLKEGVDYKAILKTSKGDIRLDLFEDKTPITANNFVFLANEGFYDGTKFHRIIKDFMIQGGDPLGNGTGSPGYVFDDEPFEGEYTPGVLAMANSGPNTNGSQFFIMTKTTTDLPKNYVIFGVVDEAKGMEVLMDIANTPVGYNRSGELSTPKEEVLINEVEILEEVAEPEIGAETTPTPEL